MVELTTFETGRNFLTLLAKGGLKRLEEHDLPCTPDGFRELVKIAKGNGSNAGYLLGPVQEEADKMTQTTPLEDLDKIFSAFEKGSCQRGIVWKVMQDLKKEEA